MLIRFSIPLSFPFHGGHTHKHLYFESDHCPTREEVLSVLREEDKDCVKYIEAADFPHVDDEVKERISYCTIGNSRMPLIATVITPYSFNGRSRKQAASEPKS